MGSASVFRRRVLLSITLAAVWIAGCSGGADGAARRAAAQAAAEKDAADHLAGFSDTLAVAAAAGYDYAEVVGRCLLRDGTAMHTLFEMTEKAPFDAASAEGHADVLGWVLRDTGDRFFGERLAEESVAVQRKVRELILYDIGYGNTALTADEIRSMYPKTFPSSYAFPY